MINNKPTPPIHSRVWEVLKKIKSPEEQEQELLKEIIEETKKLFKPK